MVKQENYSGERRQSPAELGWSLAGGSATADAGHDALPARLPIQQELHQAGHEPCPRGPQVTILFVQEAISYSDSLYNNGKNFWDIQYLLLVLLEFYIENVLIFSLTRLLFLSIIGGF